MKGKITAIAVSSSRVKSEIEAVQKEWGLLESQDEATRPTCWEEASEGLGLKNLALSEQSRDRDMER